MAIMTKVPAQHSAAPHFMLLALAGSLALAGCNAKTKKPDAAGSEAAASGALGDQIVVDPEMSGKSGEAAAGKDGPVTLKQAASSCPRRARRKPAPRRSPRAPRLPRKSATARARPRPIAPPKFSIPPLGPPSCPPPSPSIRAAP
jgi:hypothetical protein